ncbi:response regulator (plasmid) [Lichenicola cladoniae]|uniref:Response regulator n=1 Tax=Lichenicola cladoniae TaxID=1484109 RepID=A0A6M8HWG0_9PROT|nr:response regulator [Lichenicola cladoniae]NPD70093.1 response regulator [Acetobacteraceae bacterium]QKE92893.1 response regulator [Lichenicola cladoniae]
MTKFGPRVLVADDEGLVLMVMAMALEDAGYEVLTACDGAEALALIEHPDQIRLVVTDINMPAFNGFDVAKRARERHPGLPIVFVTALPDQVYARVNGEPFHCLPKPFALQRLVTTVDEMLAEL